MINDDEEEGRKRTKGRKEGGISIDDCSLKGGLKKQNVKVAEITFTLKLDKSEGHISKDGFSRISYAMRQSQQESNQAI